MYADSGDYTYPSSAERLLAQSNNWPHDVDQQLIEQKAENVRLQECNAWLEGEVGELKDEIASLKAKVYAIGRNLARAINRIDELEKMKKGPVDDTDSVQSTFRNPQ